MSPRKALPPDKRNPCTHLTMARLFDPYGSFKCSMCNRHPGIGWLYRCTQDSSGFLPESDFTGRPTLIKRWIAQDLSSHSLSHSVIKGIAQGQYTDEQIKTLIEQKGKVRDAILGQDSRPATSPASISATPSSSSEALFSTLSQNPAFSITSSTTLEEEIRAAYDWKELQTVLMSEPSIPPPDCRPKSLSHTETQDTALLAVHDCNFMICPTCRPIYRERATQSLDNILNSPTQFPPIWELQNRRISEAHIVADIGLPKADPRFHALEPPELLRSIQGVPEHTVNDADDVEGLPEPKKTHSIHKRSSFKHRVKKVLARACLKDTSATIHINDSTFRDGFYTTRSQSSCSSIFRRRRSRSTMSFVETHGRVVDTSTLHDSVMLMLATNTPLPHTPTRRNTQLYWNRQSE
ncbi:uncharacterized protein Z518_05324 [Rhinocladiella mackenziei CBS 650.93]|uniref:Uncharacterized protein n=1 Tax=Rhinocladiella mackenziei CBS 650.93 TaxID=1442369 RepID=A0A0D2IMV2_9EURO|nr:uncharacterized protein Z518_05324 [Rhinocladiella mackenziei CBS 650.93]KIX04456.1 hypothetical protein Z518_05324 [Rhinocladiella mackenziei CBS 650.93]